MFLKKYKNQGTTTSAPRKMTESISVPSVRVPCLPTLTSDEKWTAATKARFIINTCYQEKFPTNALDIAIETQQRIINRLKESLLSDQVKSVADTMSCLHSIAFCLEVQWHLNVAFQISTFEILYNNAPVGAEKFKAYEMLNLKTQDAKKYATLAKTKIEAMFV